MVKIIFPERVTQHEMIMRRAGREMGAEEVSGYRLGNIADANCRIL